MDEDVASDIAAVETAVWKILARFDVEAASGGDGGPVRVDDQRLAGARARAPALTQKVPVNGNGSYSTSNSTFVASTLGTWRWKVSYSGDSNNVATSSACGVESFTLTNG